MLYVHHPSSLEHDLSVRAPYHPDTPARIEAIEAAMDAAGWAGCERMAAPAALESELQLGPHASSRAVDSRALPCRRRPDRQRHVRCRGVLPCRTPRCRRGVRDGSRSEDRCVQCGIQWYAPVRPPRRTRSRDGLLPVQQCGDRRRARDPRARRRASVRARLGRPSRQRHRRDLPPPRRCSVCQHPPVPTVSRHRSAVRCGLWPSGLGYTINVPVSIGSDEDVWLSVLEHVLIPAALEFRPQLVLISAGFDAHHADPLGGCLLDAASFAQMACQVREMAAEVNAPVGAVLEGGDDERAHLRQRAGDDRGPQRRGRGGVDRPRPDRHLAGRRGRRGTTGTQTA